MFLIFLCIVFFFHPELQASPPQPKLVVVLVIDQFRSDYLTRFENRFLPALGKKHELGGFRYLMTQGAYYPWGEYEVLHSMTGPGHATILTGSYPYQSGIPTNAWYDHSREEPIYCTGDSSQALLNNPTQKNAQIGTSPKNLIGTTVGDELKNAGYASRVVSIALKDRASILMGGNRADLALWFDTKTLAWTSSDYYLPSGKLPHWVVGLNEELAREKNKTRTWEISGTGSGLSVLSSPSLITALNGDLSAKGFPYSLKLGSRGALTLSYGAEITEKAAERAIETYGLGLRKNPDLLAVSFSSHDYLGHLFGPNSREMEEMTIAEDRIFSKFFNFLQQKIPGGLKNILIVLTGDHGVTPNPDLMNQVHINAGRIDEAKMSETIEAHLTEKFGKSSQEKWLTYFGDFHFFINRKVTAAKGLDPSLIEEEMKNAITQSPGVAYAFSEADYRMRRLPPGMFERQILKTYFQGRSGDVILIPKPFFVEGNHTTSHISGYSYDRLVPIVFVGTPFRAGHYLTHAGVVDIAPTLSHILGILPPALSEGRVLSESLKSSPHP